MLDVKQHQDIDVEQLDNNNGSTPRWYQVLFCCRHQSFALTPQFSSPKFAQRELFLDINLQSSQISLEFNQSLFTPETCQRLINNYHRLLEDIAKSPDKQLNQLSLLAETEKNLVIEQWNHTQTELET